MHDSGKREQFDSGAVRDTAEGKSRPDLVSPYAEERIGQWMAKGAKKYSERNWEKGISISRCVASIQRHLVSFKMGKIDEDHLAAIVVNAQFIMHYEAMISSGVLPDSLNDMPDYEFVKDAAVIEESIVPLFKEGDKVRITLRNEAPPWMIEASKTANHKGVYDSDKGVFPYDHSVQLNTGRTLCLYNDELTLSGD